MSACTNCIAGMYVGTEGAASITACIDCPAGKYQPWNGASACRTCDAGRFTPRSGSVECTECNTCGPGEQVREPCSTTSDIHCIPCRSGHYNAVNTVSMTACNTCESGRFALTEGSTQCSACDAGKFQFYSGQALCVTCDTGRWSPSASSFCFECDIGSYAPEGSRECTPCEAGRTQSETAQTSCLPCDVGRWSLNASSTDPATCNLRMPLRHPAAIGCDTRDDTSNCTCMELPDYAYPAETPGHPETSANTPCEEISHPRTESPGNHSSTGPSGDLRHMCITFSDANHLLNRTSMWLNFARDYYLRGSTENAAQIAREVCAERDFLEIPCFELERVTTALTDAYDGACALARVAEAEANAFAVAEVPLTAGFDCQTGGIACSPELKQWWDNMKATQQAFEQRRATFFQEQEHADEQQSSEQEHVVDALALQNERQASADGFALQIRRFEEQIVSTQAALQVDRTALTNSLNRRISAAQAEFDQARHPSFWNSDEGHLIEDAAVVTACAAIWIGAAVTSLPSGGLSFAGAAEATASAIAIAGAMATTCAPCEKTTINAAKHLAGDIMSVAKKRLETLNMNCGDDGYADCLEHKRQIAELLDKQEGFLKFTDTMGALQNLTRVAIDHNPNHATAEIPKVHLQLADLDLLAASAAIQEDFVDASKDDALHEHVEQLIGYLKNKLKALSGYYTAMQQVQLYHTQREHFQQRAANAAQVGIAAEERRRLQEAFMDDKRLHMCHNGLILLAQQATAFEMMTLEPIPSEVEGLFKGGRSLRVARVSLADPSSYSTALVDPSLDSTGLSPGSYEDRLLSAQRQLGRQYSLWQAGKNNCGSGQQRYIRLGLSGWQLRQLENIGQVTVSVNLPLNPSHHHVTFSDLRVVIPGLKAVNNLHGNSASLLVTKSGSSSFVNEEADVLTFAHMETQPPFEMDWSVETCYFSSYPLSLDENVCAGFDYGGTPYMRLSPYGIWEIALAEFTKWNFSDVSAIRMDFDLQGIRFEGEYVPSASLGELPSVIFDGEYSPDGPDENVFDQGSNNALDVCNAAPDASEIRTALVPEPVDSVRSIKPSQVSQATSPNSHIGKISSWICVVVGSMATIALGVGCCKKRLRDKGSSKRVSLTDSLDVRKDAAYNPVV